MSHLDIRDAGTSASGKTRVWDVYASDGAGPLGSIKWHAPWRRYCLYAEWDCIWDSECLDEVARWLRTFTTAHRMKPKESA